MQRYFKDITIKESQTITIDGNDFHHIKNVMRSKVKDCFILCDLQGSCYEMEITNLDVKHLDAVAIKALTVQSNVLNIDIAQAIIRRERFEFMLQKSTELGVNKIIPLIMQNNVVKFDNKKSDKKLERWNTITKEASEQSHRNKLATVNNVLTLKQLDFSSYEHVYVCYEKETNSSTLKQYLKEKPKNILAVIGPEGGFSQTEIAYLKTIPNVKLIGLGPRILRSETASSYLLSAISYELEMSD